MIKELTNFFDGLHGNHIQANSIPKGTRSKGVQSLCDCRCECECRDIDCECDCKCDCVCDCKDD